MGQKLTKMVKNAENETSIWSAMTTGGLENQNFSRIFPSGKLKKGGSNVGGVWVCQKNFETVR